MTPAHAASMPSGRPAPATGSSATGLSATGSTPGGRIEVRDLTKRFGSFTAVDRLSFSVDPGRITSSSARTAPARRRP
ncbi:MAG: hypothetical protein R2734_09900 [Nocardioides sp.]